jgi:PPOX class probable F420-dependent enzyme
MSTTKHRRGTATMTPAEIKDFLDGGHTMIVGSHGSDGTIHLAPMWYTMIDGRPAMWTYGGSQKALNLRRDPKVTVLVEDGAAYDELRGVQMTGRMEIIDGSEEVLRVGTLIQQKYQPTTGAGAIELSELRRQAQKRTAFLVTVDRTISWDHRKLGGTY